MLPELEVDYTPIFSIPYQHLPADLREWEERESWLLDQEVRNEIKAAKGTAAAKSVCKNEGCSKITWRISLNPFPVLQKVVNVLEQEPWKCNMKKILKFIKDVKYVALDVSERHFLKSYIVKQAMLWFVDRNQDFESEMKILNGVLRVITQFYDQSFFPSFLEPSRNLIFKMVKEKEEAKASRKIKDIIENLPNIVKDIVNWQKAQRESLDDFRKELIPFAPILLAPQTLDVMARKICSIFNFSIGYKELFQDSDQITVWDVQTNKEKTVIEKKTLMIKLRNLLYNIGVHITRESSQSRPTARNMSEKNSLVENPAAFQTANSINDLLSSNNLVSLPVQEVISTAVATVAEEVPALNTFLPTAHLLMDIFNPVISKRK